MKMQDGSVQKLFQEQALYYAREDQSARQSPIISLFLDWTKNQPVKKPLKIGEFGGGGGLLLAKIAEKVSFSVELWNIEFVQKYRRLQAIRKIKFVHGSILDSKFSDETFDVLIIRDVLHHLIGKNYQATLHNQKRALEELWRMLRPGGAIFIEELVNESKLASRLIYFLSRLNSKIGLRISSLQISPYTIVAFLTPGELLGSAQKIFGSKNISKNPYQRTKSPWHLRLVHLSAHYGKMFLVVEKT